MGFFQHYFVEVDVVMDASTPLWKAHDISQQLQDKIEVLPNVGRAFVHVDHEATHIPVSALTTFHPSISHPFAHRSIGNTSNQRAFTVYHDDVTKHGLRLHLQDTTLKCSWYYVHCSELAFSCTIFRRTPR